MPINYNQFIHPYDIEAKKILNSIPGFRKLCDIFMEQYGEKCFFMMNMSGNIRLSNNQMPEIYNLLLPICIKLGIKVPELYLELNRDPNAYTFGDKNAAIVITSGLVESLTKEEIQIVMAHECGHILCQHTLYSTIIKAGVLNFAGLIRNPIFKLLYNNTIYRELCYWERCSELSADRVAAFFAGSSKPVVDVMMRLAGASKNLCLDFNKEEFLKQTKEYSEYINNSKENKAMSFGLFSFDSHPVIANRVNEIIAWANSKEFKKIDTAIYDDSILKVSLKDVFNDVRDQLQKKVKSYKRKILKFIEERIVIKRVDGNYPPTL